MHLKGDGISEPPDDGHVDEGIALLGESNGQQGARLKMLTTQLNH